jgi:single-strand DNA-binding protein
MANKINVVVIEGNLTRDPELRFTPSGTPVASLRIAHNDRVKDSTGEWTDKPYYFDVTVWGKRGEAVSQHFSKGKAILIRGRLTWREWEAQDGTKRQQVEIVADDWFFVGSKGDGQGGTTDRYGDADYSTGSSGDFAAAAASTDGTTDFTPSSSDDDIPF